MAGNQFTIPALLAATVADRGPEAALGVIRAGQLHWQTWQEIADAAGRLAASLRDLCLAPGDRVAQVSDNRYEWVVTDLALHLAGAVHVPIHVSLSGPQIAEQIADCDARRVFVSTGRLLEKFRVLLPADVQIMLHDDDPFPPRSTREQPFAVPDFAASHLSTADALATILYTSGTTGRPRGVMLSGMNLAANAAALAEAHGGGADQTRLCLLPLSHIYARTCDLYTWIYRGSRLVLAESRDSLLRDCQLARPTAISAVPYVYQRIAQQVRTSGAADEGAALRAALGGRIEKLSCGGAALAPDDEAWYARCGLSVLSGYGLTEAAPVVTTSTPACHRPGTVGKPLANVELRIAADGEVLVRGPSVMIGYWNDAAATAEALRDGWLQTGDLGELDADGFLTLRGRKKEMIALSTGKKVAPSRVEALLTASPWIEQAAVFGDGCRGLVALVVPAREASPGDRHELHSLVDAEIRQRLACAAHEEQIHQFALIDRPFSLEQGELTPKLSLCRHAIARNFAADLAGLKALQEGDSSEVASPPAKSGLGV